MFSYGPFFTAENNLSWIDLIEALGEFSFGTKVQHSIFPSFYVSVYFQYSALAGVFPQMTCSELHQPCHILLVH